jgi:hypothetical protein
VLPEALPRAIQKQLPVLGFSGGAKRQGRRVFVGCARVLHAVHAVLPFFHGTSGAVVNTC